MKKNIIISFLMFPALPVFAGAAVANVPLYTVSQVVLRLQQIVNLAIPFIIGLAVLMIIYGIFGFVTNPADEEARGQAKGYIIWGIIAVFIMVSIWGLVNILYNSFNTDSIDGQELIDNSNVILTPAGTAF